MNVLKRVATMYLISGVVFLIGFYAFTKVFAEEGKSRDYNQAFTMHAVIMVFLFIVPAIPSALSKKK
ncbi:MAG: hypothetical protein NE334_07945 [Lentisphaeraceae bacterium]|nr:hypothetical protein [Lentisphaeraceae bacterium]